MRRILKQPFLFTFLIISFCFANVMQAQIGKTEIGIASYYHDKFVGRKTATGEIFSQEKMTAAHKTLPLNSWVRVTNLSNDSVVILRINDRMPPWNKRSIDLTENAAKKLNYLHAGLTKVKIEVIPDPTKKMTKPAFVIDKTLPVNNIETKKITAIALPDYFVLPKYPMLRYIYTERKKTTFQKFVFRNK